MNLLKYLKPTSQQIVLFIIGFSVLVFFSNYASLLVCFHHPCPQADKACFAAAGQCQLAYFLKYFFISSVIFYGGNFVFTFYLRRKEAHASSSHGFKRKDHL